MADSRRTYLVRVHEVRTYEVEAGSEKEARALFDEDAEGADLPIGALTSIVRRSVAVARLEDVAGSPSSPDPPSTPDPGLGIPKIL